MKATLQHHVIAESDDVVTCGGYQYFRPGAVRLDWLEKSPKTASDLRCPHGVQFYDVVIDGVRSERGARSHEAPQPKMAHVVREFFGAIRAHARARHGGFLSSPARPSSLALCRPHD